MNLWVIIPAAGIGKRAGLQTPKQYFKIGDKTVLEHTVKRFQAIEDIKGIVVCVKPNDPYFMDLPISKQVMIANGGEERYHSVLNGLNFLEQYADENDWVLVHDAARPCVRKSDIERLITTVKKHSVGGLLAIPVKDTVKYADDQQTVKTTMSRENLWLALTPQMFRFKLLKTALELAATQKQIVTDESQAIEALNLKPLLVEGHADNIKITYPSDLALAAFFLQH